MERINRYLLCNGDANSHLTHGGLPFFLLKKGKEQDLIDKGITLRYQDTKTLKYIWNFIQFLKYGKPGGWQFSQLYAQEIFKQIKIPKNKKVNILSIYPLLPSYPWPENWEIDFYIDATTLQILKHYPVSNMISDSYQKKIINQEKINYINSKRVICRSHWAAESLLKDYKIEKNKIFVVPGGANIDINLVNSFDLLKIPPEISKKNPIKLGFIGKDWKRKGGDFLLKLADIFISKSIPFELRVIGPRKKDLPKHQSLRYLGFLDKNLNLNNFVDELRTWHFGTLFSEAEAFGISNRECMLLGVPIICHDIGGISSTLPKSDYGMIFKPNPAPLIVYKWVMDILCPYDNYIELRKKLFRKRKEFSWENSIASLKGILD